MKFTIVTPAFNSARFLRKTVMSVLAQEGDFHIEYILQDGGSSDETLAIWEECKTKNTNPRITMYAYSERDAGMYDAINKGFMHASGDIFAWINSDDYYLPGALTKIAEAFTSSADIRWVKGINWIVDESGAILRKNKHMVYKQAWIRLGLYGRYAPFIEQETVFWRRSLWEEAGPLDASLRYAGDYKLWISFAAHAPLVSIPAAVAAFRRHTGQLSQDAGHYQAEMAKVLLPAGSFLEWRVKAWFWLRRKLGL